MTMLLERLNTHLRDSMIHFREQDHHYWLDHDVQTGAEPLVSATTLISSYFPEFDPVRQAEDMMMEESFPFKDYFGMTRDQIVLQWQKSGKEAADLGTKLHALIEDWYNLEPVERQRRVPEIISETTPPSSYPLEFRKHFMFFYRDYFYLQPYRTEWRIFDEEYRVCGSVDMVFRDKQDPSSYWIYDWKRNVNLDQRDQYGHRALPPLSHVVDNRYWHHSLQLSLYRFILERRYGMKIKGMVLVCLHPDQQSYLKLDVPFLQNEIQLVLNERMTTLLQYNQLLKTPLVATLLLNSKSVTNAIYANLIHLLKQSQRQSSSEKEINNQEQQLLKLRRCKQLFWMLLKVCT